MSSSLVSAAVIGRAAAPVIKDLYESAKGEVKSALNSWKAASFPQKLARQLAQIDSVRTIWSPEENVSLRDFYYPCTIVSRDYERVTVKSVSDLGQDSIVIQGFVGQGKSILLRYLAIQEITNKDNKRIPIFLELRKVTKENTLMNLIKSTLSVYGVSVGDGVFSYLAASGKIVLFLDGFDEVGADFAIRTASEIEDLIAKFPELQVVVSSRPGNEIQKLNVLRTVEISSLKKDDYAPFLKALKISAVKVFEIVNAIKESPSDVSGLIRTPLMLTLVVFVYTSEKQIPAELPEFFEKLFYTVFTRHDKLKPLFEREHHSGLSERKLQQLFEAFCFMSMQIGSGRTLTAERFSEAFEFSQEYVDGAVCDEKGFKRDITKVACLMLEEGLGDVTFLHKSIAEYHAAAFVRSSDDVFAKRFYMESSKQWKEWRECIRFLESIDPYRYAKFFSIPGLTKAIPSFKALLKCKNSKELLAALPDWIKRVSLNYREYDIPSECGFSSFGSWEVAENIYEAELVELLSKFAFNIAPKKLTVHEIDEIRESGVVVEKGELDGWEILLADAVYLWGEEDFKGMLSQFIEDLSLKLAREKLLAEKSKSRALIFDRKQKV